MTGLEITARSGYYEYMQPNIITIFGSLDNDTYTKLGEISYSDGTLLRTTPTSYAALYAAEKVRYLKVEADYGGSNMGTGEFNIYVK